MATRAQVAKETAEKKGVAKKRARKLSMRKPTKTNRYGPKAVKAPRTKRDATANIAHEVEASSSGARVARAKAKATRVRAKSPPKA